MPMLISFLDNKPSKQTPLLQIPYRAQSSSVPSQHEETSHYGRTEAGFLPAHDHKVLTIRSSGEIQMRSPPSVYLPRPILSYIDLFTSEFFSTFCQSRRQDLRADVWVFELPSLMSNVPQSSALVYAVRAATIAYCGKKHGNKSMQAEACYWYDKGLEKQRLDSQQTQRQLANGVNIDESLGVATICAPILFSLFESLMDTSFAAWASHLKGAVRMLEMRGPENCQSGVIHQLFRSARLGAVSFILGFLTNMTDLCRYTWA